MRIHAVCVGTPRTVEWKGREIRTSIFKSPVTGDVRVERLDLRGDQQSDLTVHGGPDKAVYAYPLEHYDAWRGAMPDVEFGASSFGENLTTEGLLEHEAEIGDRYRVGTALLEIAQPRIPCYKLGIRLGTPDAVRQFVLMRRPGMYFRVIEEGTVVAGAAIEPLTPSGSGVTVREVFEALVGAIRDAASLRRIAAAAGLPRGICAQLEARAAAE